jgi:osmoprotectant transport system permease protein
VIAETIAWLADAAHWAGPNGIPARLAEHVAISTVSLAIALAIALPIGLWIGHTGRAVAIAINGANLWRALPSFAVIAIVLPITAQIDPQAGFKVYPTVAAMIVLGLPPILVNTYAGITGVDRDVVEAARGQGMTERQLLARVELPLALPTIGTGVRSAAVQIVATATLGAVFGFGGLGRYLVDGIAQADAGQTVGGALLVAGLVVATELVFVALLRQLMPPPLRRPARSTPGAVGVSPL